MNKKNQTSGFTLVELLAVLVILAIIALIAIVTIKNVMNKTSEVIDSDTEKQIINAAEKWAIENSDKFDDTEAVSMQVGLDVAFVLDMSGSMNTKDIVSSNGTKITRNQAMIEATDSAMKQLTDLNPGTRMGITLYGSSGIDFLKLNNYGSDTGSFIRYYNGKIYTTTSLKLNGINYATKSQELSGCTYTQAGIAAGANQLLSSTDTKNRIPVIIMLSDGAPSVGTTHYNDVLKYNSRNSANVGKCATEGDEDSSFGTIRTASYYKKIVSEKYNNASTFFYTIGFGLNAGSYEEAVLNPTTEKMEILKNKYGIARYFYQNWQNDGKKDYSYADGAYIGKMDAATLKQLFINISNEVIEATKVTQMCVTVDDLYKEGYIAKKDIKLSDGTMASEYVLISMNEATNQFAYSLAKTDEQKSACKELLKNDK